MFGHGDEGYKPVAGDDPNNQDPNAEAAASAGGAEARPWYGALPQDEEGALGAVAADHSGSASSSSSSSSVSAVPAAADPAAATGVMKKHLSGLPWFINYLLRKEKPPPRFKEDSEAPAFSAPWRKSGLSRDQRDEVEASEKRQDSRELQLARNGLEIRTLESELQKKNMSTKDADVQRCSHLSERIAVLEAQQVKLNKEADSELETILQKQQALLAANKSRPAAKKKASNRKEALRYHTAHLSGAVDTLIDNKGAEISVALRESMQLILVSSLVSRYLKKGLYYYAEALSDLAASQIGLANKVDEAFKSSSLCSSASTVSKRILAVMKRTVFLTINREYKRELESLSIPAVIDSSITALERAFGAGELSEVKFGEAEQIIREIVGGLKEQRELDAEEDGSLVELAGGLVESPLKKAIEDYKAAKKALQETLKEGRENGQSVGLANKLLALLARHEQQEVFSYLPATILLEKVNVQLSPALSRTADQMLNDDLAALSSVLVMNSGLKVRSPSGEVSDDSQLAPSRPPTSKDRYYALKNEFYSVIQGASLERTSQARTLIKLLSEYERLEGFNFKTFAALLKKCSSGTGSRLNAAIADVKRLLNQKYVDLKERLLALVRAQAPNEVKKLVDLLNKYAPHIGKLWFMPGSVAQKLALACRVIDGEPQRAGAAIDSLVSAYESSVDRMISAARKEYRNALGKTDSCRAVFDDIGRVIEQYNVLPTKDSGIAREFYIQLLDQREDLAGLKALLGQAKAALKEGYEAQKTAYCGESGDNLEQINKLLPGQDKPWFKQGGMGLSFHECAQKLKEIKQLAGLSEEERWRQADACSNALKKQIHNAHYVGMFDALIAKRKELKKSDADYIAIEALLDCAKQWVKFSLMDPVILEDAWMLALDVLVGSYEAQGHTLQGLVDKLREDLGKRYDLAKAELLKATSNAEQNLRIESLFEVFDRHKGKAWFNPSFAYQLCADNRAVTEGGLEAKKKEFIQKQYFWAKNALMAKFKTLDEKVKDARFNPVLLMLRKLDWYEERANPDLVAATAELDIALSSFDASEISKLQGATDNVAKLLGKEYDAAKTGLNRACTPAEGGASSLLQASALLMSKQVEATKQREGKDFDYASGTELLEATRAVVGNPFDQNQRETLEEKAQSFDEKHSVTFAQKAAATAALVVGAAIMVVSAVLLVHTLGFSGFGIQFGLSMMSASAAIATEATVATLGVAATAKSASFLRQGGLFSSTAKKKSEKLLAPVEGAAAVSGDSRTGSRTAGGDRDLRDVAGSSRVPWPPGAS
jgi:hypothetical protein